MKKFLKILGAFCLIANFIVFAAYSTYKNTFKIQENLPSQSSIQSYENVSPAVPIQHRYVIEKSRKSAVRILSYSARMDGVASLSGTYFTSFGRHYVLTVMHGLGSSCYFTKIMVDNKFYNCVKYVTINPVDDYAIIEIEKIPERTPVRIPKDIPKNQDWKKDISIMTPVYHTGYPNNMGPLTFDGHISGYSLDNFLYVKSYAWSGSSGSGVFNQEGKLIGYVLALDVGFSEYGGDIIEDIVVVVPVNVVKWGSFFEEVMNLKQWRKLYPFNLGDTLTK